MRPCEALVLALVLLLEWWLGRTPLVRASSVVELVFHVIESLIRRNNVIIQKTTNVAKETDDVMALIVDVVRKLKAGVKPQELALQELPLLGTAVSGGEQIPAEYDADPEAVMRTVMGRAGELLAILVAAKKP